MYIIKENDKMFRIAHFHRQAVLTTTPTGERVKGRPAGGGAHGNREAGGRQDGDMEAGGGDRGSRAGRGRARGWLTVAKNWKA